MGQEHKLTTGEILRNVRVAKDLSQETLAKKILCHHTIISKIEKGDRECTNEMLFDMKKAMDAEILPLFDNELEHFELKLQEWYHVINEREWGKAKKMQEKLAVITFNTNAKELNMLYSLFDCKLLLGQDDLKGAKSILDALDAQADGLRDMPLYHYYFNKGTYETKNKRNKEALNFYLEAYKLMKGRFEKDITLYTNIAYCYRELGLFSRAISFLEEARKFVKNEDSIPEFNMYNSLATLNIQTGRLQDAKNFLDICLTKAKNMGKKRYIGIALLNYGFLHRVNKDWNISIEYFDKALETFEKKERNYLEALYQKILCLIQIQYFTAAVKLLSEAMAWARDNEEYTISFESLKHLLTPNAKDSIEYIESVTVPYLVKNYYYYAALDFCSFLREYYSKKRISRQAKALEIAEIVWDIHSKMYEGGVIK